MLAANAWRSRGSHFNFWNIQFWGHCRALGLCSTEQGYEHSCDRIRNHSGIGLHHSNEYQRLRTFLTPTITSIVSDAIPATTGPTHAAIMSASSNATSAIVGLSQSSECLRYGPNSSSFSTGSGGECTGLPQSGVTVATGLTTDLSV